MSHRGAKRDCVDLAEARENLTVRQGRGSYRGVVSLVQIVHLVTQGLYLSLRDR